MKGILLAGGRGSRMGPLTATISKQLLPVHDKPLVFYSLSVLLLADIREILIITRSDQLPLFEALLGDGSDVGCRFRFAVQPEPRGLAEAFLLGADFIAGQPVALVLGDNLFLGSDFGDQIRRHRRPQEAVVFTCPVSDPEHYGIVQLGPDGRVLALEEKPSHPESRDAITGLYFYDPVVVELAASLRPSARGEYEITDLNRAFLDRGTLRVERLAEGTCWMDVGTPESLTEAARRVRGAQRRLDACLGSPAVTAYQRGFIDRRQLLSLAGRYGESDYGQLLRREAERTGTHAGAETGSSL